MSSEQAPQQPPTPSAQVTALRRLVGTWTVSGGAEGTVTYEFMTGGFFLQQRVELEQYGEQITGLEVIGQLRPFGEEPSEHVRSRFYDNHGNSLDYVYELTGDTLLIWRARRVRRPISRAASTPTTPRSQASGSIQAVAATRRP